MVINPAQFAGGGLRRVNRRPAPRPARGSGPRPMQSGDQTTGLEIVSGSVIRDVAGSEDDLIERLELTTAFFQRVRFLPGELEAVIAAVSSLAWTNDHARS